MIFDLIDSCEEESSEMEIRPDHEWTRVYATRKQAEKLKKDMSFIGPLVISSFKRMIAERTGSIVIVEFILDTGSKGVYLSSRWNEMEMWLERCKFHYEKRMDYEECAIINSMLRDIAMMSVEPRVLLERN